MVPYQHRDSWRRGLLPRCGGGGTGPGSAARLRPQLGPCLGTGREPPGPHSPPLWPMHGAGQGVMPVPPEGQPIQESRRRGGGSLPDGSQAWARPGMPGLGSPAQHCPAGSTLAPTLGIWSGLLEVPSPQTPPQPSLHPFPARPTRSVRSRSPLPVPSPTPRAGLWPRRPVVLRPAPPRPAPLSSPAAEPALPLRDFAIPGQAPPRPRLRPARALPQFQGRPPLLPPSAGPRPAPAPRPRPRHSRAAPPHPFGRPRPEASRSGQAPPLFPLAAAVAAARRRDQAGPTFLGAR